MATKKQSDNPKFSKTNPGRGHRHCNSCDGWTRGPASSECAGCGKTFPKRWRKTGKGNKANFVRQAIVQGFVKKHGGLVAAKRTVGQVSGMANWFGSVEGLVKFLNLLEKLGGLEATRNMVGQVVEIANSVGGVGGLAEILDLLEKLSVKHPKAR